MTFRKTIAAITLLSGAALCATAQAQSQPVKTGEQVYKETCVTCHGTGLLKAPKFGDKKDWAELIKEPQATLTADGWVGVRDMPAKGGKPDLAIEAFARAVAYMARSAGATWKDPDAAMMKQIQAEEKKALDKKAKEAKDGKAKK
jgi:cytochrome c5